MGNLVVAASLKRSDFNLSLRRRNHQQRWWRCEALAARSQNWNWLCSKVLNPLLAQVVMMMGQTADSEFVTKVISDTCEICRIQARVNWQIWESYWCKRFDKFQVCDGDDDNHHSKSWNWLCSKVYKPIVVGRRRVWLEKTCLRVFRSGSEVLGMK